MSTRAVVLLSGGLDSTTALYRAIRDGFAVHALSFDYGQRHRHELEAAARVARLAGVVEHRVVRIGLGDFGGSALTADIAVPRDRDDAAIGHGIPVTYVPARNTVFLALALAWAEVLGAEEIVIGINQLDSSGYPDCRPEFLDAFAALASVATRAGVEGRPLRVQAPLIDMSKAEIIRLGLSLGVDYAMTHSCYDPDGDGRACGRCDACLLRLRGFAAAGVEDPAAYAEDVARPDREAVRR